MSVLLAGLSVCVTVLVATPNSKTAPRQSSTGTNAPPCGTNTPPGGVNAPPINRTNAAIALAARAAVLYAAVAPLDTNSDGTLDAGELAVLVQALTNGTLPLPLFAPILCGGGGPQVLLKTPESPWSQQWAELVFDQGSPTRQVSG